MQNNLILQRHHRCWGHWLYFKDVVTLSGSHKDVGWSTALNRCDLLALPLSLFHKLALSRWQMSCHPQPEEACLRKDNRNRVCHFPLIIYTDGLFLLLLARLFQLCDWAMADAENFTPRIRECPLTQQVSTLLWQIIIIAVSLCHCNSLWRKQSKWLRLLDPRHGDVAAVKENWTRPEMRKSVKGLIQTGEAICHQRPFCPRACWYQIENKVTRL